MGFNIPNAADAEHASQAQPDSRDFSEILAPALSGTGVVTGCAVTPQGSPNMTVAVAAGSVAVAGTTVAVTGGNVTITTADATNARFDLICVDNAGVKSAVAGTPAANPVFPTAGGKVVLAAVRVPAAVASINAAKIVDKRSTAVLPVAAFSTGMMQMWASTVAPGGWQLCDGSAISRTTFATLFALIGSSYGAGDGSTTFNVPDLRGRAAVGVGTNADVSAIAASDGLAVATRSPKHNSSVGTLAVGGAPAVGTLALPNHVHSINGDSAVKVLPPGSGGQGVTTSAEHQDLNVTSPSVGNPTTLPAITGAPALGSLAVTGTPGPGGTRPVDTPGYLAVNYIIKT